MKSKLYFIFLNVTAKVWNGYNRGKPGTKCIRVYGSSLENMDYPIPGKVFSTRHSAGDTKPDPGLKSMSLHHIIRGEDNQHAERIRSFDKIIADDAESADFRNIKEYCRLLRLASTEELRKCDVIFCTTTVATGPRILESCRGKIYQMIMDEAGMCTEPQSIAAIIATQAKQVVLVGDHKQLRPVVKATQAKNLGLEKSLFERYAQRASFLSSQYRMVSEINISFS